MLKFFEISQTPLGLMKTKKAVLTSSLSETPLNVVIGSFLWILKIVRQLGVVIDSNLGNRLCTSKEYSFFRRVFVPLLPLLFFADILRHDLRIRCLKNVF